MSRRVEYGCDRCGRVEILKIEKKDEPYQPAGWLTSSPKPHTSELLCPSCVAERTALVDAAYKEFQERGAQRRQQVIAEMVTNIPDFVPADIKH